MNVLMILMLVATSVARFVTYNQVRHLFIKFAHGRLTKHENETLTGVFEILQMNQYMSGGPVYRMSTPRMSLHCLACRAAVAVLFDGVYLGLTDKQLSWALTKLCAALRIATHNVCKGAVELNVPIIAHVIRTTPQAAPRTFCGLVLQKDDDPNVCVYKDARFEWQVELPEPDTAKKRLHSQRRSRPLKVALITDVHLDPLYEPGGVANCGEPSCCRKGQTVSRDIQYRNIDDSIYEQSFIRRKNDIVLDLSFVPKIKKIREAKKKRNRVEPEKVDPVGYWGDYRNCDTPLWTFNDFIDRIASAHKSVDVVYYIGDTIDHHVWDTTYARNHRMNRYVIRKLRKSFHNDVLVVPVIGNHESQPINEFAPASVKGNELNTTWLYKSLAKKWRHYLPKDARVTFWKFGVYSMRVRPGLKAIVMNSNVAYKFNWWVVYNPLDAKKHLEWLVEELYKAELDGDKVHILSHIPPGDADLTHTWTREYNRIVNRFASTIAAEFNGHMHWDEFKIFYNSEGVASRVAWNGGGLATFSRFNPNYKIINFHRHTHEPTSIQSYIFNLTKANLEPKRKPHWFKLYNFRRKFRLPDLSPASMDNLVNRMVSDEDDNTLLDLYVDYVYKLSDARPYCDTDCKFDYICRTVVTVLWDRQKCDDLAKKLRLKHL